MNFLRFIELPEWKETKKAFPDLYTKTSSLSNPNCFIVSPFIDRLYFLRLNNQNTNIKGEIPLPFNKYVYNGHSFEESN